MLEYLGSLSTAPKCVLAVIMSELKLLCELEDLLYAAVEVAVLFPYQAYMQHDRVFQWYLAYLPVPRNDDII